MIFNNQGDLCSQLKLEHLALIIEYLKSHED